MQANVRRASEVFLLVLLVIATTSLHAWEIRQITNDEYNDYAPSLHKGQIAWYKTLPGDGEIMFWDGTTIRQITDNSIDDIGP